MKANTERNQSHEERIALHWLSVSKRDLDAGKPVFTLTQSFDAIVGDWEESGKLRVNHRKIDFAKVKSIAIGQLRGNPHWAGLLAHFQGV